MDCVRGKFDILHQVLGVYAVALRKDVADCRLLKSCMFYLHSKCQAYVSANQKCKCCAALFEMLDPSPKGLAFVASIQSLTTGFSSWVEPASSGMLQFTQHKLHEHEAKKGSWIPRKLYLASVCQSKSFGAIYDIYLDGEE